jgi:hypothetical protein
MQVRISFFTIDGTYMYDVLLEHAYKAHLELLLHIRTQLNDSKLADCPKDQLFYTLVNPYDGNRHSYPHLFLPVELRPPATYPLHGYVLEDMTLDDCRFDRGHVYDFTHHVSLEMFNQLIKDKKVRDARTNTGPGQSG